MISKSSQEVEVALVQQSSRTRVVGIRKGLSANRIECFGLEIKSAQHRISK